MANEKEKLLTEWIRVEIVVLVYHYNILQGPMECILAAAVTGVVFALFAGQPLNILGSTGPMLVLEMILYKFCQ
jgi:hypothetical protein